MACLFISPDRKVSPFYAAMSAVETDQPFQVDGFGTEYYDPAASRRATLRDWPPVWVAARMDGRAWPEFKPHSIAIFGNCIPDADTVAAFDAELPKIVPSCADRIAYGPLTQSGMDFFDQVFERWAEAVIEFQSQCAYNILMCCCPALEGIPKNCRSLVYAYAFSVRALGKISERSGPSMDTLLVNVKLHAHPKNQLMNPFYGSFTIDVPRDAIVNDVKRGVRKLVWDENNARSPDLRVDADELL